LSLDSSELATAKGILRDWAPLFYAMTSHRTHRGETLDFNTHPYLKQFYADSSPNLGAMKATQGGFSEYVLCREISLAMSGRNIFHVLPTDKLIGRFVRERFDKTVINTRAYRNALHENRGTDNVTMKQLGKGTIAFVGSNSASSFTEFPADDGIIDENDRCDQKNILMVEDRLAASKHPTKFVIGNPTITDFGIHKLWKNSKRWKWHIKCECGQWVQPFFFDHVVKQEDEGIWTYRDTEWEPNLGRDINMICSCGRVLDRKSDGVWIAEDPNSDASFYQIGKEFSTQVTIGEMCKSFSAGLDDDSAMARFYNSDLGLPYTPKGSKIDSSLIEGCIGDYSLPDRSEKVCVAGVDVGTVMHTRINEILPDGSERAVFFGELREIEELQEVCRRFNVVCGVIDAMPEIRLSKQVSKWKGWFRCEFHSAKSQDKVDLANRKVTVNRTEILDNVKARLSEKRVSFPRNVASIPRYMQQMLLLTRVYNEARMEYEWIGDGADHYHLSEAYVALARRIISMI